MLDQFTLQNGLRVVAEKLPHFRSVSVGLWVKAGSMDETPEEGGLSHFIEHMLFKGTERRSARQIAEDLAADQISISAVYRNISALEEEGLLKRSVREGTREVFYQYIASEACKDSLHLACRVCGKSIHLGEQEATQLIRGTLESTGFQIDKTETILYGVCADCRK